MHHAQDVQKISQCFHGIKIRMSSNKMLWSDRCKKNYEKIFDGVEMNVQNMYLYIVTKLLSN